MGLMKRRRRRRDDVLDFLLRGKPNKEIARSLGIGVKGVKWHVTQLLKEFGCKSRAQLIALYGMEAVALQDTPAFSELLKLNED